MAKLTITTLWNVNVILNGVNTLGRLAEFDVPQPKRLMADFKATGMASKIKIPLGWDELEATLKWESFDAATLAALATMNAPASLTLNADAQVISAAGVIQDIPVVGHLVGPVVDPGPVMIKGQENFSQDTKMSVWHVDLTVNGQQIYLFDALSNQYIANGVDMLAGFRGNLGV